MLQSLSIKNIVLIDSLDVSMHSGLCVLTGETGAGKSILLDSLGFALGERASARLLRHGEAKGSVVAAFDISHNQPAKAVLEEIEIECEDGDVYLRRSIDSNGKNRAFINDIAVNVQSLKRLGQCLLEIHGQHEQSTLLSSSTHRNILDEFGELRSQRQAVAEAFIDWVKLQDVINNIQQSREEAQREESYLSFVVNELEKLNVNSGEEEELATKRAHLMHREKIAESLARTTALLSGEQDVASALQSAQSALMPALEYLPSLSEVIEMLERASIEVSEAANQIEDLANQDQDEETSLEEVEERLFALRAAARKYGTDVEGLNQFLKETQTKLSLLSSEAGDVEILQAKCEQAKKLFVEKATSLTKARKTVAKNLENRVMEELSGLKMQQTRFEVKVEPQEESLWNESGIDKVQFIASTNPGTPLAPIAKIASGGELSRFMLALKVALAHVKSVPTLVFDEVDTGIGGAVADAVGKRLATLGKVAQVLVVTHQPQVASKGNFHLKVSKQSNDSDTFTRIEPLSELERQEELARMLAGEKITSEARAAAGKLLQIEEV